MGRGAISVWRILQLFRKKDGTGCLSVSKFLIYKINTSFVYKEKT
jgi:hypothetical protein